MKSFRDIQKATRNYLKKNTGAFNWWASMFANTTFNALLTRPAPAGYVFTDDVYDAFASAYQKRWAQRTASGAWNKHMPLQNGFGAIVEIGCAGIYAPAEFKEVADPSPVGTVIQAAVARIRAHEAWATTVVAAERNAGAAMHFGTEVVERIADLAEYITRENPNVPLCDWLVQAIESGQIDPEISRGLGKTTELGQNCDTKGLIGGNEGGYATGMGAGVSSIGVKASVALESMAGLLANPKLIQLVGKFAAAITPGVQRERDLGPYFTNIRRSDELDLLFEDEKNRLGDSDAGIASMATIEFLESGLLADDTETSVEETGDFVILMDRSGSMKSPMQDGLTCYEVAAALTAAAHSEATARGRTARVLLYNGGATEVPLPGDVLGNLGVLVECHGAAGGTNSGVAFHAAQDGISDMSDFLVITDGADRLEWTREVIGQGCKVTVLTIGGNSREDLILYCGLHEQAATVAVPSNLSTEQAAEAFFATI